MPILTVAIAAHNAGPYIQRCVSSVIRSPGAFEVVAVDDGSTDDTESRLRRMADRDGRVRVIRHRTAMGSSAARNAGLAAATGDFVWWIDGDDWLVEGAVDRILQRLTTGFDMLCVGHVPVIDDRWNDPAPTLDLLRRAPDVPFTVEQWPEAIGFFAGTWTKVLRRDFLQRHGIRFPDLAAACPYDDIAHHFRALLEASAIMAEPSVCYAWRLGRPGARSSAMGAQHLCWAAQWDDVLSRGRSMSRPVQDALLRRMVIHGWAVLDDPHGFRRLEGDDRRRFFLDLVRLYRRFRRHGGRYDPFLELGSWRVARMRRPMLDRVDRLSMGRNAHRAGDTRRGR